MDWNEISRWLVPMVALSANLFVGWVAWSIKKKFVTREDCSKCHKDVEERQKALEDLQRAESTRQCLLEKALESLPSAKDMQQISLNLSELRGDLKGLTAKVEGQGRSLARVEKSVDFLTEAHMGKA